MRADLPQGMRQLQSIAKRLPPRLIHLVLAALLPVGAVAGQASSSMEVTVEVVGADASTAAAALIETVGIDNSGDSAVNTDAACKAIGNTVIRDGVWATCSLDPGSHTYLLTVQY